MKTPKYYTLDATFDYVPGEGEPTELDTMLDNVVEHLMDLDARDVNIVADTSINTFALSHVVLAHPGESIETVLGRGMGTVRAAFHACEAGTPGWPSLDKMLTYVAVTPSRELVEVEQDVVDPVLAGV